MIQSTQSATGVLLNVNGDLVEVLHQEQVAFSSPELAEYNCPQGFLQNDDCLARIFTFAKHFEEQNFP